MFNLGLSEIILISIIALIFIGPKQLPEIAQAIGRALNELKRASDDLKGSITNPKNYMTPEAPPKITQTELPPHSDGSHHAPVGLPLENSTEAVDATRKSKPDEGSST